MNSEHSQEPASQVARHRYRRKQFTIDLCIAGNMTDASEGRSEIPK